MHDGAWDSEYFSINNFEPFCAHSSHIRILCTENGIVSQELKDNLNKIKKNMKRLGILLIIKCLEICLLTILREKDLSSKLLWSAVWS